MIEPRIMAVSPGADGIDLTALRILADIEGEPLFGCTPVDRAHGDAQPGGGSAGRSAVSRSTSAR